MKILILASKKPQAHTVTQLNQREALQNKPVLLAEDLLNTTACMCHCSLIPGMASLLLELE